MSIGSASKGRLINGKTLPWNRGWITRSPSRQYGTNELVDGLVRTIKSFMGKYPKSCKIVTGDISYKNGGPMRPHRSHQSGRDIDIGFFAKNNRLLAHFEVMTPEKMDAAKTWAFIESMLEENQIEYILIDYSLQKPLYDYVKNSLGASDNYLLRVFQYPRGIGTRTGIIRHARGHKNHMHVRFFTPKAVAAAHMYSDTLGSVMAKLNNPENLPPANNVKYLARKGRRARKFITGSPVVIMSNGPSGLAGDEIETYYVVSRGDNLSSIAAKYNIPVADLAENNGLNIYSKLRPGAQLRVSLSVDSEDDDLLANSVFLSKHGSRNNLYGVKKGDTLWSVALANNVKIADLCQWNDITFRTKLEAGQKLFILKKPALYAVASDLAITSDMLGLTPDFNSMTFSERLFSIWHGYTWTTVKNFFTYMIWT